MLHIWTPERFATATAAADNLGMDAPSIEDLRRNHVDEADEYEFVLGRRQMASLSFVVLVLIAAFAGIAYLAGRAAARINAGSTQSSLQTSMQNGQPSAAELPAASAPAITAQTNLSDAPLFADPIPGAIYIQTAATDRGVGVIMAEGLRTHGLSSFVAPGPSDKIFRVLVGPFPNMTTYQQVKTTLDQIGVSAFARFQK